MSAHRARLTPRQRLRPLLMPLMPLSFVALLLATGCTAVVRVPAPQARVVVRDMPAPVAETPPPPPGPSMHWVPGHWVWRDGGWRWAPGHYVGYEVPPMPSVVQETITIAPSPAHGWVRGHWRWGGRAWVWVGGQWVVN